MSDAFFTPDVMHHHDRVILMGILFDIAEMIEIFFFDSPQYSTKFVSLCANRGPIRSLYTYSTD